MSHANISVFVPHNGCPHQCSFCNQRGITGISKQPSKEDVVSAIEISLKNSVKKIDSRELAFFGGSFTAINRDYMIELLEAAKPYVDCGQLQGIRLSTRPDAIDEEILALLKFYGVTSIELGAQSMVDEVLRLNNRGHSSRDVENASRLIKKYGFELGLQMMVGLYGSDYKKDLYTGQKFIELKPDTVRIYPTVIMKNTELENLYKSGKYTPMQFDETVELCSKLLDEFEKSHIKVIRLGLHSSESLKEDIVAGVWHPAFREICESRRFFCRFVHESEKLFKDVKKLAVRINPKDISKFVGQKRCNLKEIGKLGYDIKLIADDEVDKDNIKLEELF